MVQWIRLIAMAASFVVTVVLQCVPGVTEYAEWGAMLATFVLAAWNAWKNNDFTFAAKTGTKVMHAIKDGKITEDEVKNILGNIEE